MGEAPFLPPTTSATPSATRATPKALPSSADIARLTAGGFRRRARRQRRRSHATGWLVAGVFLAAAGGAGYLAYDAFVGQPADAETQASGVAGALGGAIGGVEGLERGVVIPVGLEGTVELADVTAEQVFPAYAAGVAESLGRIDGLEVYSVNADDLFDLQPQETRTWLRLLASLPQSAGPSALLPAPSDGDLTIGLQASDGVVWRLVVRSVDPALNIDLTR